MSRNKTQKLFVLTLTLIWGALFIIAFVLGALGLFGPAEGFGGLSVLTTFLLGHLAAGLIAVAVAIVAAGTQSQSVRRLANVSMAGTGLMALCSASLGAFFLVMS